MVVVIRSHTDRRNLCTGATSVYRPALPPSENAPKVAFGPELEYTVPDEFPERGLFRVMTMRFFMIMLAFLANISACVSSSAIGAVDTSSYRLNPGDVLLISVWKEPELTREVAVLPDGSISFPLAGHINAAGLTPEELQSELAKRIEKYIPDASELVSVSVKQASGNVVYVIGLVNKPGEFPVAQPTTVMQALSLAGGLTPFASEESIKVIRREDGIEIAIPFDYSVVKLGRSLDKNIELKSGDVVVVSGKSLF